MTSPLDRFMPTSDVRERFETTIRAPRELVMRTAYDFDLQSLPPVRAILRLRTLVMGGSPDSKPRTPVGLLAETRELGWGTLLEVPGRLLLCGAVCRPWLGDVRFSAVPAEDFAGYAEADRVKIAWSLEAVESEPDLTRFSHEVRASATDRTSREKFARYWRWARFGIVAIRLFLLPAIRRAAEREARPVER